MKTYSSSTPRVAITVAAAAMTAITLGLSVLPATMNTTGARPAFTNVSHNLGSTAGAIPGDRMPIVVYGVREQETAMQRLEVPRAAPPRKQQS